jgi:hypothetical protein
MKKQAEVSRANFDRVTWTDRVRHVPRGDWTTSLQTLCGVWAEWPAKTAKDAELPNCKQCQRALAAKETRGGTTPKR